MNTEELLIDQIRVRIIDESIPRIKKCLSLLEPEQIWKRPSPNLASIGHLILHLNGNARQWLLSGLADLPDNRVRDAEFETKEQLSKQELSDLLHSLENDLKVNMKNMNGLTNERDVQCYRETGVSIIVHVIEHFSYHTGQIAYYTKILTSRDLEFYPDSDLNQTQS